MNDLEEIKKIVVAYSSIIDIDDSEEACHLIADLQETFRRLKNGEQNLEHILEKLDRDFIPENELKSLLTIEEFDFINSIIKEGNRKIRWVCGLNLGTRALSIMR